MADISRLYIFVIDKQWLVNIISFNYVRACIIFAEANNYSSLNTLEI